MLIQCDPYLSVQITFCEVDMFLGEVQHLSLGK
jgi:hypothetical protein